MKVKETFLASYFNEMIYGVGHCKKGLYLTRFCYSSSYQAFEINWQLKLETNAITDIATQYATTYGFTHEYTGSTAYLLTATTLVNTVEQIMVSLW